MNQELVKSLYISGLSGASIAKQTGESQTSILRVVKSLGISRPRGGRRLIDHAVVLELYRSGKSCSQIGKQLNINFSTAAAIVRAAGETRGTSEAVNLRWANRNTLVPRGTSFFPLTIEKAWLLGVIFGDGHVANRNIIIVSGDLDILEKSRDTIGASTPIKKQGKYWLLNLSSAALCTELREWFFLNSKKSASITFPNIETDLHRHFIRGLVDTDGCFCIERKRGFLKLIYCSNSARIAIGVSEAINKITGILLGSISERNTNKNPLYILQYSHHSAIAIGKWLYEGDTQHIRCERKFEKWKSISSPSVPVAC